MNLSIAIMEEEHSNINRALAVVRTICLQMMQGAEVPDDDFRQIIDFIRKRYFFIMFHFQTPLSVCSTLQKKFCKSRSPPKDEERCKL